MSPPRFLDLRHIAVTGLATNQAHHMNIMRKSDFRLRPKDSLRATLIILVIIVVAIAATGNVARLIRFFANLLGMAFGASSLVGKISIGGNGAFVNLVVALPAAYRFVRFVAENQVRFAFRVDDIESGALIAGKGGGRQNPKEQQQARKA